MVANPYAERKLPDLLSGAADFIRHVCAPEGTFDRLGRCSVCSYMRDLVVALEERAARLRVRAPSRKSA